MSNRLTGKKILVTAAAQGIGLAIAEHCAEEDANVIATDINLELLDKALNGRANVAIQKLDVLSADAIAAAAAEHGALDGLANIAGFVHHGSILDASEDEWDFALDLNVRAAARMTKAFLPAMLDNGGGSIVNISSIASSLRGIVNRCVYGTTKAAVIGLTKSVAADFIKQGVRCNAICPGTVQSPSLDDRIAAFDDPEAARRDFVARQPMGRLGTADEIAAMAVYLLADESSFTTGTTMSVDGGVCL